MWGSDPGRRLVPENFFYGAPDAILVRDPTELPSRERVPVAQVVVMDVDLDAVRAARGGDLEDLMEPHPRKNGRLHVVRSPSRRR
jgi:hypothetical protein